MRYRFLGQPDHRYPNLKNGKVYNLVVVTRFWSHKPMIVKPFYCPYKNWMAFYLNWRPMTMKMVRLENRGLDKITKVNHN